MNKILLVIFSCICYTSFIYGQHPPNKLGIESFNRNSGEVEDNYHFTFVSMCDVGKDSSELKKLKSFDFNDVLKIEKDNNYLYLNIYLSDFAGGGSLIKNAPLIDDKKIIVLQIIRDSTIMNLYLGFEELMLEGRIACINNFKFKEGHFFIDIIDDRTSIIDDAIIDFSKSKKLSKAKLKKFIKQTNCAEILSTL